MTPDFATDEFCRSLDSTSDPIVIVDEAGRVTFINASAEKLFGYVRAELFGRPAEVLISDWVRGGHQGRPDAGVKDPRAHPPGAGFAASGRRKDGTEFPIRVNSSPTRIDGRFVLAIVTDTSTRSGGETAPRTGDEPIRGAFGHTGLSLVLSDIENRFVWVDAAFAQCLGRSQAEMLGMTMAEITHPDDLHESYARSKALLSGEGQSFQMENRYLHRDGRVLWGLTNVSLVGEAGGQAHLYLGQVQDVTARKLAEDESRHAAARARAVFEATTAGMVEISHDGHFFMANSAFCRMIGYTAAELREMTVADVLFPDDRDRVLAQYGEVAAGRATSYEADRQYRRKDGSSLWARVCVVAQHEIGRPTSVSAVVVDLTDRKQLEEQLRHAQKMEAVGLRASGIAHDFNNLLTVINGCAEILLDGLPSADPTRELVQEMTAACQRAAGLTAQLLAFGRKATFEPRILNLNEVVSQSTRILRRLLGPGITLVTNLAKDPSSVKADPRQIEQIILNLVINAKDAMPQGGRLTIQTHGIRLREEDTGAYLDLTPGEYVQLTVSDTGAGMTDEVKAQAFEPFFTTKEVGKGTGLGLAVVHGAVKQSGGRVNVNSALGVGTTFDILFPAAAAGASGAGTARSVPRAGTVLLVENEREERKTVRLALEAEGYSVLEATGGAEALRLAREHAGSIELLMTDAVMPGVGGREVADALRAQHPGIKVLYIRGYTDDAVARHGTVGATDAFLQKPFTPLALAHTVRAVLDSTA